MMIDCHCHLEDDEFSKDLNEVILRAREYGILMVCSGLGLEGATRAVELSHQYKDVKATAGLAPYSKEAPDEVIEFIKDNRKNIIGIGEVGLDHHWGKTDADRKHQESVFRKFIRLSKELDLPLVVHSRSAGERVLDILIEENAERVLLHAFDGKASLAARAVEKGFFFSIPPCVVHSEQKQLLVKAVPLENLCLESDAPVLGIDPKARNEPVFIIDAATRIAQLKSVPPQEVVEETTQNAKRLYRL